MFVYVVGLVTTPGGSWGGYQMSWKLPGVVVKVTGLVTTPGPSLGDNKVLWKLPLFVLQVTGLEELGVVTRS